MTITLSNLPEELQRFLAAKVASGAARSAEDYILALLQREAAAEGQAGPAPAEEEPVSEEEMRRRVQEFHERLYQLGIISEIRPLPTQRAEKEDFKPIEIKGPPLSQTITEDRR